MGQMQSLTRWSLGERLVFNQVSGSWKIRLFFSPQTSEAAPFPPSVAGSRPETRQLLPGRTLAVNHTSARLRCCFPMSEAKAQQKFRALVLRPIERNHGYMNLTTLTTVAHQL